MQDFIKQKISASIKVKRGILDDEILLGKIETFAKTALNTLKSGGKLIFFGNGGSAADSQHLACEFVVRFKKERAPLAAISLTTDTSILTACSNDYSFDRVFQRQVRALGNKHDLCVGISTSGNSANVVGAFREAKSMGIYTVGLTGLGGGKVKDFADLLINVPSTVTSHIQEAHILIGHIICEIVEEKLS